MARSFIVTFVILAVLGFGAGAAAQPVVSPWPVDGPDDTVAVAAAALSGWYAAADSFEDSVEVRDIRGELIATVTRQQILALVPWMSLDGGPDGPCGLAWSSSGRVLYILVYDDTTPGDGLGSDAVLRFEPATGALSTFARLELAGSAAAWPRLSAVFFRGRLYVGTGAGGGARVRVYSAPANSATGFLLSDSALPGGSAVRGLSFEHDSGVLFAASESAVYRASTASGTLPLSFTGVGTLANIRAITFADHYGPASNTRRGLYVLRDSPAAPGGAAAQLDFVPAAQALGGGGFSPTAYATSPTAWHDVCATADGRLFLGADEDAVMIADAADGRLGFDAWLADEFEQVVSFCKGLISPDGEPAGWVIDADVQAGGTRFHPATPDGAAWVVLALLMSDRINGDAEARPLVRQVLTRYAGLAPDGIGPSRSADGIFRHWINPATGGVKPGWDPEFATLSTMKIVAAAARAAAYYPDDPQIRAAASEIIFGVGNWGAYLHPVTGGVYYKALAGGGPDTSVTGQPFNEGIIFVEQAAAYGGAGPAGVYANWLNRGLWPTAQYLPNRPITGGWPGGFQSAFVSLYSLLLQSEYRGSAAWRSQVQNLRWSSAGWTDDFAPRYFTVFSAGTTAGQWGGYHADSLGYHPGNLTTFPSLMALCATGNTAEAVGAYHAYRKGARQTFRTGASLLYRRSDVDRAYTPDSAGLPDVVLGALGLAELLEPGSIQQVLTGAYPATLGCAVDWDGSGVVNSSDISAFITAWLSSVQNSDLIADFNGDMVVNSNDISGFIAAWLDAVVNGC